MADVLSSLAAAVADARAQISVGPMPMVLGDRLSLAQLLQNLVANALKFRSGPSACVWVTAEREHDTMWRLTVADDGIGIDPRHRNRVFKMFQRLHDREAFEGTGIGLAICRKIVERQGGRDLGGGPRGRRIGVLLHDSGGACARARRARAGRADARRYAGGLSRSPPIAPSASAP